MRIEDLIKQVTGRETVLEPSQAKKPQKGKQAVGERPYQEHRSRGDTETLIKTMLQETGRAMTITEIARRLNRTVSPHLRAILNGMVAEEKLIEEADTAPNERMARFWYSLPTQQKARSK